MFTFQSFKFWNDKTDQNINFDKLPSVIFGIIYSSATHDTTRNTTLNLSTVLSYLVLINCLQLLSLYFVLDFASLWHWQLKASLDTILPQWKISVWMNIQNRNILENIMAIKIYRKIYNIQIFWKINEISYCKMGLD